jgi:hypothetical protein
MGLTKYKLAGEDGQVEGIIISRSSDKYINCALEFTKNISIRYWRIVGNQLNIIKNDEKVEKYFEDFKKLSPYGKNRLINKLNIS